MMSQTERSYRWLFWMLAVAGFAVDQASKYGIFYGLYNNGLENKIALLDGKFELSTQYLVGQRDTSDGLLHLLRTLGGDTLPYVNTGALFGMGRDSNLLFALVSVAAAVAILAWSMRPAAGRDRFLSVALGLILAGTLGNLYDRVVYGGVRDFLHWYYLVDWPVFNLADCCLVCGACLLLLQAFGTRHESEHACHATTLTSLPEVAEAK
jgi:signal peptidase II